jgi:hypothetical protein
MLLRVEGALHFAVPEAVLAKHQHVDLDSLSDAIVHEQHGSHHHRYFEFIGDDCFAEVENPFWRHHH